MKKILTGTLSLLLLAGAAQAQKQDSTRHFKAGQDRMAQELNLSADQKQKLQALRQDQQKEMKALRDKYQNERQSILTAEQRQELQQLQAQRKQDRKAQMKGGKGQFKHHKGMNGMMGRNQNAELQKQLNLTQEQQDKMAKLKTDMRAQMQALHNNQSLTQEQKKEKMQSMMKEHREKMKSILTKEQQDKMQSMKKERKSRKSK